MTKILILEDDDFIRQQLAGILQEKGYLVVEAASVGQFNNIYEQEEAVIDVFLLDVYLPDGNGFDVCRKIREHGSQIIIFLTSCDDEDSINKRHEYELDKEWFKHIVGKEDTIERLKTDKLFELLRRLCLYDPSFEFVGISPNNDEILVYKLRK